MELSRQAQTLQFPRRQCRCASFEAEISEPEIKKHFKPGENFRNDALRHEGTFRGVCLGLAAIPVWRNSRQQALERKRRNLGDVIACEFYRQRFWAQSLAVAGRADGAKHV